MHSEYRDDESQRMTRDDARRGLEEALYEIKRVIVGQDAVLEVMQEQQVTIGGETFPTPLPFLVMATQNPIESEGTYPLPEAQVDRFLMKVLVDYPSTGEEAQVVARSLDESPDVRERLSLES